MEEEGAFSKLEWMGGLFADGMHDIWRLILFWYVGMVWYGIEM